MFYGFIWYFKKKPKEEVTDSVDLTAPAITTYSSTEEIIVPHYKGEFGGTVIKVLKEDYQVWGFEKEYEKNSILCSGANYYYQTIENSVGSARNGRPITNYSEFVYKLKTKNLDNISSDNIYDFIISEPVFDKITSEPGVGFWFYSFAYYVIESAVWFLIKKQNLLSLESRFFVI